MHEKSAVVPDVVAHTNRVIYVEKNAEKARAFRFENLIFLNVQSSINRLRAFRLDTKRKFKLPGYLSEMLMMENHGCIQFT